MHQPKKEQQQQPETGFGEQLKANQAPVSFSDHRPETLQLQSLQSIIRNSENVQQFAAQQQTIQRKPQAHNGLPQALKSGVEQLSGISMDDVQVHYNSSKPAQLNAHAYAQGNQIHLASGQEQHLPHEAWHVVQQKQGRVKPTVQLKQSIPVNDDTNLEREADLMGQKAAQLKVSSEAEQPILAQRSLPGLAVVQGVFIKTKDGRYQDTETGDFFVFRYQNNAGNYILEGERRMVMITPKGVLIESQPKPKPSSETHDNSPEKEKESPPTFMESSSEIEEGIVEFPETEGKEGLNEDMQASKLTSDLTFQIVLFPLSTGELVGKEESDFPDHKYTANQLLVESILMGDQDRPDTRFENQESHTVAWTLVRHGIMGLADQPLSDLLDYVMELFLEIEPLTKTEEGGTLLMATTGYDILKSLLGAKLRIDIWQRQITLLLKSYMQIYQLSSSSVFKRGKAKGHGEAHARKRLENDEMLIKEGKKTRSPKKMALDAAKMLDVQFRVNSLGVREYAFAVKHWIDTLTHALPAMMKLYGHEIIAPVLNKSVAKSFKDELSIPQKNKFTVKDLLDFYSYAHDPVHGKEKQMRLMKKVAETPHLDQLSTNFVANIGVLPLEAGSPETIKYKLGDHEQSVQVAHYPIKSLLIGHVFISDRDRPKTKFIKNQKSHTVSWTLARAAMLGMSHKPVTALFSFLHHEFNILIKDVTNKEGFNLVKHGLMMLEQFGDKSLPIFRWQGLCSQLVRQYFIAYQVADSASYVNPSEAERALGHGEPAHMLVLRRNQYSIVSRDNLLDPPERIIQAATSLFDGEITKTLSAEGVKLAYNNLMHKLNAAFPAVFEHFHKQITEELFKRQVHSNGTKLGDLFK